MSMTDSAPAPDTLIERVRTLARSSMRVAQVASVDPLAIDPRDYQVLATALNDAATALAAREQEARALRDALREVDEILTEAGWHTDRGLLFRVRAALAAIP